MSPTAKTWCFMFTLGGKFCRMKLGTYPATSLAKARGAAYEARAELEADPPRDPRAKRVEAAPETLRAIADDWFKREGIRLRTGEDRKRVLKNAIYPTVGNRLVADIRRNEIAELRRAAGPSSALSTQRSFERYDLWGQHPPRWLGPERSLRQSLNDRLSLTGDFANDLAGRLHLRHEADALSGPKGHRFNIALSIRGRCVRLVPNDLPT